MEKYSNCFRLCLCLGGHIAQVNKSRTTGSTPERVCQFQPEPEWIRSQTEAESGVVDKVITTTSNFSKNKTGVYQEESINFYKIRSQTGAGVILELGAE